MSINKRLNKGDPLSFLTSYMFLKSLHILMVGILTGNIFSVCFNSHNEFKNQNIRIYKHFLKNQHRRFLLLIYPVLFLVFFTGTINILINNYNAYHDYYVLFGAYAVFAILLNCVFLIRRTQKSIMKRLEEGGDFAKLHWVWMFLEGLNLGIIAITTWVMTTKLPLF